MIPGDFVIVGNTFDYVDKSRRVFAVFNDTESHSVSDEVATNEFCIVLSQPQHTPWGSFIKIATPRAKVGWIHVGVCNIV